MKIEKLKEGDFFKTNKDANNMVWCLMDKDPDEEICRAELLVGEITATFDYGTKVYKD